MKKIVYIGNHLNSKNPTTLELLTKILRVNDFKVFVYSNKSNKLLRLLDMCFGVLKHRNSDYLLIDTYSTFNFYYTFFTSQLARLFSLKYIPILHGGNLPKRIENSPYLSKLIFKYSFINVAPSGYLLDAFQKKGYKTIQIPNAIDLKLYPYKKRKYLEPKLLWVRAFDKIYNPTMTIEVLKLLKEKYSTATLCMIGADKDGSLQEVKSLVKKYNLFDAVEFTGYMSKDEWIEKSKGYDVFINTTNFDNTPVSVIEAMALGLPITSTNVGGLPFLINNDCDGVLVNKEDVNGMVNAIVGLLNNPEASLQLTNNARIKVSEFDTAIVVKKWNHLLNTDVI